MTKTVSETPNGYQVRTDATKALLLDAAEEVIVRDGFEGAQLENIAKVAGKTKGAIYAHYRSKEDLFLALYEDRTRRQIQLLAGRLQSCRTRAGAIKQFKGFIFELTKDRTWPLLTLEFKLYSVRHPESRELWIQLYELVSSIGRSSILDGPFGQITRKKQEQIELKAVAIGPVLSSLILESYFQPILLSEERLWALLDRFLDVILEDIV